MVGAELPDASPGAALLARSAVAALPSVAALGCGPGLTAAVSRSRGAKAYGTLASLLARLPWTRSASARAAAGLGAGIWARGHSDDVLAAILLSLDAAGVPVRGQMGRGRGQRGQGPGGRGRGCALAGWEAAPNDWRGRALLARSPARVQPLAQPRAPPAARCPSLHRWQQPTP